MVSSAAIDVLRKDGTDRNSRRMQFQSLQAGRGIAAIMVVLYHTEGILSLTKYWHSTTHYFYFGARGVDFFFVLSGIVLFHAHREDMGRPGRVVDYYWKRVRRIYPIYWVVLLATLPAFFFSSSFGNGLARSPYAIVESLILLPIVHVGTIIPVAWTLYHEVMFYLVFSLLLWRRTFGAVTMWLWMFASVCSLVVTPANPVVAAYLSPLHLLFGVGMVIAILVRHTSFPGLPLAVIGACGFAILSYADDAIRSNVSFLPLAFGLCAGMVASGLMLYEKQRDIRTPAFLSLLGDASYSIYLIHYAALSLTAKVVFRLWRVHSVPVWVGAGILLIIAVTSGVALHILVEKPLLRWLPRAIKTIK
jgi:exopolysaccharide production protein ExoZ